MTEQDVPTDPGSPTPADGPAEEVAEMPDAAPDEATDAALVDAALGDPATAVVDDPEGGPTGPLGDEVELTAAEEAAGTAPGEPTEELPGDEHVAGTGEAALDDEAPSS